MLIFYDEFEDDSYETTGLLWYIITQRVIADK